MLKHAKILLVDDDPDDQFFFLDALREVAPAIECDVANNGQEALEHVKIPPPPSLIILDINMPVMDGFECLGYLKKSKPHKHIPIIIFTTSDRLEDRRKAISLGASHFCTKPSGVDELKTKISEFLQTDFK